MSNDAYLMTCLVGCGKPLEPTSIVLPEGDTCFVAFIAASLYVENFKSGLTARMAS